MKIEKKNQGLIILGFLVLFVAIVTVASYLPFAEVRNAPNQKTYTNTHDEQITATDTESVKNKTYNFFATFKEGMALNENILTDLTYQHFNSDFLANAFPQEKSKLFGIYGYGKLTHSFTTMEGLQEEGGISSFEVLDVQQDNVNRTITTYVRMDALDLNTVHWIEWRDIPEEGWKINAVSFDGNIEVLSNAISPKQQF
ncbi:hypothetical protein ACJEBK_28145 [Peribacillus frigoritolerans]|uniref:hypothetical protein n=1 Tax=Peribacillus frigoritolerans TaxID=450367 RepID=UPI0037C74172